MSVCTSVAALASKLLNQFWSNLHLTCILSEHEGARNYFETPILVKTSKLVFNCLQKTAPNFDTTYVKNRAWGPLPFGIQPIPKKWALSSCFYTTRILYLY